MSKYFLVLLIIVLSALLACTSASHTCSSASVCGRLSGLVPFHKDAIHASLVWSSAAAECPKMLIWMRPSEYRPIDYVLPTRDEFSGFNETYVRLVQGNFSLGQLDRSGIRMHVIFIFFWEC